MLNAQSHTEHGSPIVDLDTECPFGHASTKHLLNEGSKVDFLDNAEASNKQRARILGNFASFLQGSEKPFRRGVSPSFQEIALRSVILNHRAPKNLAEIIPLHDDRTHQHVWNNLLADGTAVSKFLSYEHTEAMKDTGHHSLAAKSVLRRLNDELFEEFKYCTNQGLDHYVLPPNDRGGHQLSCCLALTGVDARVLKHYQLFQERWLDRRSLQRLNAILEDSANLVQLVLDVQMHICTELLNFLQEYPQFTTSRVTFGEIALWDPDEERFVPSSRLLKAIVHNVGPWLLDSDRSRPKEALLSSISAARDFGAFDQFVSHLSYQSDQWRWHGTMRKICPARISLSRIIESTLNKEEKNGN